MLNLRIYNPQMSRQTSNCHDKCRDNLFVMTYSRQTMTTNVLSYRRKICHDAGEFVNDTPDLSWHSMDPKWSVMTKGSLVMMPRMWMTPEVCHIQKKSRRQKFLLWPRLMSRMPPLHHNIEETTTCRTNPPDYLKQPFHQASCCCIVADVVAERGWKGTETMLSLAVTCQGGWMLLSEIMRSSRRPLALLWFSTSMLFGFFFFWVLCLCRFRFRVGDQQIVMCQVAYWGVTFQVAWADPLVMVMQGDVSFWDSVGVMSCHHVAVLRRKISKG